MAYVSKEKDDYLTKYNMKKKELIEYAQKCSMKMNELDKQDEVYKSNIESLAEQTNNLISMRRTHLINDTESFNGGF